MDEGDGHCAPGPLEGVRVLDLTRALAGPLCTMVLGDLGADIVKVERPLSGDDTRAWGPPFVASESAYFLGLNRNKRSIEVDMSKPEGAALVRQLASRADILVDNFKPSDVDKFGFTEKWRRGYAGKLVHVHISGYGRGGPWESRPGYDFIIQAESGLMSITGEIDAEPTKWGVAMVDYCTGLNAAVSAIAAHVRRVATGGGQRVDVNLHESGLGMLANVAYNYLISGEAAQRYGNGHPNIVPYRTFSARDGEFALAVGNDAQFTRLASVLGRPEWAQDERYRTNGARVQHRAEVDAMVQEEIAGESREYWTGLLSAKGIPCGAINTVAEALNTPQATTRNVVQTVPHPIVGELPMLKPAMDLGVTPATIRRPPPLLGEHTEEVLLEWGHEQHQIKRLRDAAVIL